MIEQIETTSEETADGATNVADAAHEQTESLAGVATRVDELATEADALLTLLDEFDLGDRPAASSSTTSTGTSAEAGAD